MPYRIKNDGEKVISLQEIQEYFTEHYNADKFLVQYRRNTVTIVTVCLEDKETGWTLTGYETNN
ncbi:hypothetical protein JFL43_07760 [Viridibacillus sp. YIM B01967]|uniref:Uncharacterized protein n=1 Tax=Viridibacillus soli TaxID=2798301 RepID=A0ABS1H5Q5_9BACL|nr:hypothetical protein [Viridibacillus soli]MBK3494753.1 hypothetical protein [Viridibacillus soli]